MNVFKVNLDGHKENSFCRKLNSDAVLHKRTSGVRKIKPVQYLFYEIVIFIAIVTSAVRKYSQNVQRYL